MSRRLHRLWLGAVLVCGAPWCAQAQDLMSNQPWSQVSIRGDVSVSGTLPLSLDDLPPGSYRLTARGFGYPKAEARLTRTAGGEFEVHRLHGAESLFFPPGGMHLRDGDDRLRGLVMVTTAGVAIAQGLSENGHVSRSNDDLESAQQAYNDAVTETEIRNARVDLAVTAQEISDREEMRNLWLGTAGYLWLGAALESWLLTPKPDVTAATGGYRLSGPEASKGAAALRSVLMPGGGQRYLGNTGRGNWYLAGVSIFGLGALAAQQRYLDKSRDQLRVQEEFNLATDQADIDRLRGDLRKAHNDVRNAEALRWALVGLTAGTYVWNILDAATHDTQTGGGQGLSLQLAPQGDGVQAQLNWRIK